MKLVTQSPKKALKAFLKQRPSESERDKFKNNLNNSFAGFILNATQKKKTE